MIKTETLNHTKPTKKSMFFRDFTVSALMLGLLMSFSKLVKFVVLLIQDLVSLSNAFDNELEAIERGSKYIVRTKTGSHWEVSNELNNTVEALSNQISSSQISIALFLFFSLVAFVILYFALDFLIEYTNKFKPWSIILLLSTFVSSVFYLEFTDLYYSGNGYAFMFTATISIVTGILLVGYSLIFPNYRPVAE